MSTVTISRTPNKDRMAGKWASCIAALLVEPTVKDAAKKAGVSQATLRRYLQDARFLRQFRRARKAVVEAAIGRLQALAGKAIAALDQLLDSPDPRVLVKAVGLTLAHVMRGVDHDELQEKVDDLERTVEALRRDEPTA